MTDSAFSPFLPDAIAEKALRATTRDGLLSVADVTANVRKATWTRVGFAAVMAGLSLAVLPVAVAAAWLAFIAAWELVVRVAIEDRIVTPAARRSQQEGFYWLAAVHFVGGLAFTAYPVLAWSTGESVGMVLATAWICSSANHVFVYFTPNRLVTWACLGPLAICALAAPFTVGGFTAPALVASAALTALIVSAGIVGLDRRVLLGSLAKHAAARTAAEQANAAKSQFLATMSHELRTPLNSVIGYAELIEEEAETGPLAEDAGHIRSSARQLLGVIDVILDLSRLETGQIKLERERTVGSAVVEQLRESALPLAIINGNTLTIIEATPLGESDIDHKRLYQCLLQLISNAAKFTRDGEITVTARRKSASGRTRLVFEVADNGMGISEEDRERIFDPFVQGESNTARRHEGTGLGLTLVRRLARLMGGDVACESAPGQGAVFTLWIDAGPA
jgi:signal transduction histidine kinase